MDQENKALRERLGDLQRVNASLLKDKDAYVKANLALEGLLAQKGQILANLLPGVAQATKQLVDALPEDNKKENNKIPRSANVHAEADGDAEKEEEEEEGLAPPLPIECQLERALTALYQEQGKIVEVNAKMASDITSVTNDRDQLKVVHDALVQQHEQSLRAAVVQSHATATRCDALEKENELLAGGWVT